MINFLRPVLAATANQSSRNIKLANGIALNRSRDCLWRQCGPMFVMLERYFVPRCHLFKRWSVSVFALLKLHFKLKTSQ